jgi:hypothetical protein
MGIKLGAPGKDISRDVTAVRIAISVSYHPNHSPTSKLGGGYDVSTTARLLFDSTQLCGACTLFTSV